MGIEINEIMAPFLTVSGFTDRPLCVNQTSFEQVSSFDYKISSPAKWANKRKGDKNQQFLRAFAPFKSIFNDIAYEGYNMCSIKQATSFRKKTLPPQLSAQNMAWTAVIWELHETGPSFRRAWPIQVTRVRLKIPVLVGKCKIPWKKELRSTQPTAYQIIWNIFFYCSFSRKSLLPSKIGFE